MQTRWGLPTIAVLFCFALLFSPSQGLSFPSRQLLDHYCSPSKHGQCGWLGIAISPIWVVTPFRHPSGALLHRSFLPSPLPFFSDIWPNLTAFAGPATFKREKGPWTGPRYVFFFRFFSSSLICLSPTFFFSFRMTLAIPFN